MRIPTVLLVDDDHSTLDLIACTLQGKGYRILEATDAREALQAATGYTGPIPLLVTDIAMPEMNGIELAKQICFRRPETKVLYITAYRDAFDVGAGPLIDKPFIPEELLAKVQEMVFPAHGALQLGGGARGLGNSLQLGYSRRSSLTVEGISMRAKKITAAASLLKALLTAGWRSIGRTFESWQLARIHWPPSVQLKKTGAVSKTYSSSGRHQERSCSLPA